MHYLIISKCPRSFRKTDVFETDLSIFSQAYTHCDESDFFDTKTYLG